ncbi:MAG: hypothetical protein EOM50_07345 [Erysipelotrichia bacterium]|nr:hypothetical protein [Erysipelotrichia bacterium]NCC54353.1 hypothetical protein [Erysipelotrichia bacterium]
MTNNNEQKISDDLMYMNEQKIPFEYVLYGNLAPQTKRIVILASMWIVFGLVFILQVLPFAFPTFLLGLLLLLITYLFFYDKVYVAKLGKYLYIHSFDKLKFTHKRKKVMLKSVVFIQQRSSDFHLTLQTPLAQKQYFIIFKRSYEKKGYPNQATNMKKIVLDINKKHKK